QSSISMVNEMNGLLMRLGQSVLSFLPSFYYKY
uniref:Uncharacterized protein n=1 Tax=Solanum lycopersicum TaxID=4081 RepID=A0A3Q7FDF5_SOLLC